MSDELSEEDYQVLAEADNLMNGAVGEVLNNNGKAGWTVCPRCRSDDFLHMKGCELASPTQQSE